MLGVALNLLIEIARTLMHGARESEEVELRQFFIGGFARLLRGAEQVLDRLEWRLDRLEWHRSSMHDDLILVLRFRHGELYNIRMPHSLQHSLRHRALDRLLHELTTLWWRCWEDHQLEVASRTMYEAVRQLERIGAPPWEIERAQRQAGERMRHIRQHHSGVIPLRPGSFMTATAAPRWQDARFASAVAEAEAARRRCDQYLEEIVRSQQSSNAAQTRAEQLLIAALSTTQRAQYLADKRFEVVGSHDGRYLINFGRQMNIDELDRRGRKVCGWCFLPSGGLCEADTMLAQKIALETDEPGALKVANRIENVMNRNQGYQNFDSFGFGFLALGR